jgi:hypothetical protein
VLILALFVLYDDSFMKIDTWISGRLAFLKDEKRSVRGNGSRVKKEGRGFTRKSDKSKQTGFPFL